MYPWTYHGDDIIPHERDCCSFLITFDFPDVLKWPKVKKFASVMITVMVTDVTYWYMTFR